jgi:integrase/recombinase XerD
VNPSELAALVPSWEIHLRAERKTDGTIKTYLDGVRPYLRWCDEGSVDPLDRLALQAWTTGLLDAGRAPSTAKTRMMGVRHFTRWLADEGEIPDDPFVRMRPPTVDQPIVPVLTDDQLRALVKACAPPTVEERVGLPSLRHRRDEALVRLMFETGMRAGEVVALEVDDVDLQHGVATVRRGKGGKGRVDPFGPDASLALDRYLRARRGHRLAGTSELWPGDRGKRFSYDALHKTHSGTTVATRSPMLSSEAGRSVSPLARSRLSNSWVSLTGSISSCSPNGNPITVTARSNRGGGARESVVGPPACGASAFDGPPGY